MGSGEALGYFGAKIISCSIQKEKKEEIWKNEEDFLFYIKGSVKNKQTIGENQLFLCSILIALMDTIATYLGEAMKFPASTDQNSPKKLAKTISAMERCITFVILGIMAWAYRSW